MIFVQFVGVCPGDKIPSSENLLYCVCPSETIKAADHRCLMCGEGVSNEEQDACVGMLNWICYTDKSKTQHILTK